MGATSLKGQILAEQPLFAVKMYGHEGMPAWVEAVEKSSGKKIAHSFSGIFEPFSSTTEYATIRDRVFHKRFTGCFNVELIGRRQFAAKGLADELSPSAWRGAFHYFQDGWVDPEGLLDAMEAAFLKTGGEFRETEVVAVRPGTEDLIELLPKDGDPVSAETVILAAGIFTDQILAASGLAGLEQQAVPGETLVGEDGLPEANLALRVGKLNYVRQGRTVRIGSTSQNPVKSLPERPQPGDLPHLQEKASKAFGWSGTTASKWGIRGRYRDRMPAIGQLFFAGRSFGPWVSAGYHKNGIQLSHLFAQNLANLLEGAPPSALIRPFLLDRFPAFSTGRR